MFFKKVLLSGLAIILVPAIIFAQYSQRSLLEKDIYFINNGKVQTAKYWSLPIGKSAVKITREFPGEGKVSIDAEMNFALISSGYIEGNGYGSRGKCGSEAHFFIKEGDTAKAIDLGEIDYIFEDGAKVRLKTGTVAELWVNCETNEFTISGMDIMIWIYDNFYKELKHSKDINGISAFSFTKDGAVRALKAK
jgi:hypothetical protein